MFTKKDLKTGKTVDYAMMYMGNVFPSHSAAFNRVDEFKYIYKSLEKK